MFSYLVRRILAGLMILVLISMMVYALFWYGPRSPALELCRRDTNNRCSDERLEAYEERLGYDNPIYVEYGKWAKGMVAGRTLEIGAGRAYDCPAPCLGVSYRDRSLVTEQLKDRFPVTVSITVGAAALYLLIGVPIGVASARRRGTVADRFLVSSTLIVSSIPYYLFALLSFLLLTISTDLFPRVGYTSFFSNPASWFSGLILVWLVMGLFGATQYTRFSRGAMVDVLSEDYVRTAKAKGLPSRAITVKHGLRAALVPVATIFGLDVAYLLGGTIFTEQIFQLEGIGKWGLEATYIKDLPVVQATSLIFAVFVVLMNIIVDIAYSVLDPRVRLV